MDEIVAGLGSELSESEQAAIQQHLEGCEQCREQFRRMGLIVRHLADPEPDQPTGQPHLSDLDLAAFAHARFGAEDAGRIIRHLSECAECRSLLTAARLAMDDYEQRQDASGLNWDEIRDELRIAVSTPRRRLYLLGSVVAYLAQCLLFAVALGQLILGYAVAGPDYWTVPDFWPLGAIPEGATRLWVLVVACGGGGLLMRALTAYLYRGAISGPRMVSGQR